MALQFPLVRIDSVLGRDGGACKKHESVLRKLDGARLAKHLSTHRGMHHARAFRILRSSFLTCFSSASILSR